MVGIYDAARRGDVSAFSTELMRETKNVACLYRTLIQTLYAKATICPSRSLYVFETIRSLKCCLLNLALSLILGILMAILY
uniref:Uncharacterized protein n=1 Tax=Gibberella zeae TaxID=5518 RepID=A0A4E9DFF2_GIBZA